MQRKDGEKELGRRFQIIVIAWLVLFGSMVGVSIFTHTDPSRRWLIPFGCLAIASGVQLIRYRKEAAELQWQQHHAFFGRFAGPKTFLYQPAFTAVFGGFWLALGIVFVLTGIIG